MRRLAITLNLRPYALLDEGIEILEDRCWARAQQLVEGRLATLNAMMTVASSYMGSKDSYEHYVHHQLGNAYVRREYTLDDYMVLNAIASGSLKEVN